MKKVPNLRPWILSSSRVFLVINCVDPDPKNSRIRIQIWSWSTKLLITVDYLIWHTFIFVAQLTQWTIEQWTCVIKVNSTCLGRAEPAVFCRRHLHLLRLPVRGHRLRGAHGHQDQRWCRHPRDSTRQDIRHYVKPFFLSTFYEEKQLLEIKSDVKNKK